MAKEKDNSTNNKTFLLRVDSETMEAVEKWAADEFRSVNGQLQWIIAEALKKSDCFARNLAVRQSKNELI